MSKWQDSRRLTWLHITDFNIAFNDTSFWSEAAHHTTDPQPQALLQYHVPPWLKNDGVIQSVPWNGVQQQLDAPAPEQTDPPSRSSIERLTPSSGSSVELSPKVSPDPFRFKQRPKANKTDGMHAARQRHHNPSKIRKHPKKKSTSPPLSTTSLESAENLTLTFCNMSPENWGKGAFDGISDLSRSSQKGRKGALSEDTRANALRVRKRGACFCCHVRKVKCDEKRPCRNCDKLRVQVSQAICWRFEDFTKVLFPAFTRGHFAHEEMSRFVSDNVQAFTLNGVEQHCTVSLSSGSALMSKLVVKAEFFTARMPTSDVLQHWFRAKMCADQAELERQDAVPIGLDMDGTKWNELRRKVGDYVHDIVQEPAYASQLTASDGEPSLPRRMSRKMLQIVHRYAQQSKSPIVKRALSIHAMYYVIRKHLTLTQESIFALQPIYSIDARCSGVTPRLLNRQIKAVTDELVHKEVVDLFEDFSKRLKKKSREEWAPCLAAFVVLCMLMEDIVAAADVFVKSDNKVEMRKIQQLEDVECARGPEINKVKEDISKLPFNQFAFQFHQIYQTYLRDASAKSFNPLTDGMLAGSNLNELGDLNKTDLEMVRSLRDMLQTECKCPGLPMLQHGHLAMVGMTLETNVDCSYGAAQHGKSCSATG